MAKPLHPWKSKIVDTTPAETLIEFCSMLKQPDGMHSGKPIIVADFQKEIAQIFCKDINGDRVVNRVLITVPRKSGKTALISFFLLYLLVVETIPHAQHYSIAFDRDQAAIIFNYARNIINMTPELDGIISITESRKLLTNIKTGSTFQALSSEGRSKHGKSSRVVIVDELHTFGQDGDLLSIMETSCGAYGKEALIIIIGTQSPDDNSIMSEWVDYANKVNDGILDDDTFAGFVWSAPEEADIWDEKVWYECNPGMQAGFRSIDEMRQVAKRAKELGGSKVAEFENLYLNKRVESTNPFITKDAWQSNKIMPNYDIFKTERVFAGMDLSKRGDLTSLVLVCQDEKNIIHVKAYAWTPQELLGAHEKSDKAPYKKWAGDGYLEAVPGSSISYDWLAIRLGQIASNIYNLESIHFDRWRISELEHELDKAGVVLPLVPHGQGYKDMAGAIDDLEHAIASKELAHGNNPVMNWCISNTVIDEDPAGNRKMAKDKSFGRIDVSVALAMAVHGLRLDQLSGGVMNTEEAIMFV